MSKYKRLKSWIVILVIILFLTFFQLPYYVTTPGMAKKLSPIINVEGGYDDEAGDFMLTTIRIGKANIMEYVWAKVSDYHHLYKEEDLRHQGETDKEYKERQLRMMDNSKEAAIYVAYKEAGEEVQLKTKNVLVQGVLENMPAFGKLEVGDILLAIDQIKVGNSSALIDYISKKQAGDKVNVKFQRDGMTEEVTITLQHFSHLMEKIGLGVRLLENNIVEADPNITIRTDEIGGPSAGLMFTLEIYNQLVEQDITKGLQIAGTGTINYDGEVGRIGGVKQKVVAAHKAGAAIFFAPNENGADQSNYQEALEAAKDINTDMKIIPVDTFQDALAYLKTLN